MVHVIAQKAQQHHHLRDDGLKKGQSYYVNIRNALDSSKITGFRVLLECLQNIKTNLITTINTPIPYRYLRNSLTESIRLGSCSLCFVATLGGCALEMFRSRMGRWIGI